MKGYAILYVHEIRDAALFEEYKATARGSAAPMGGQAIVTYGRQEVVEGPDLAGVVVMEFPSFEAAREWYHSDRYREATAIRQRAVRGHFVLVEGRPDP